mmetsp:Transcript_3894/g.11286  ORF Transcript_3894/g.11286 Transcript_3894/m.11286 type:complete len:214 (+) Transcript_3894:1406-2047(+)
MALLQEAVEGDEHAHHGQLVRIAEVQRLRHGNEHLIIHAPRHPLLLHPLLHCEVILALHVILPPNDGREQTNRELDLLLPSQHLVVPEDGNDAIEGRRQVREVKPRELSGGVGHGEDHRVLLPLQPVLDAQLPEHVHHIGIGPEEYVQSGLDPVPVLILPGGDFAAQEVPRLQHDGDVAGVRQVLGSGETSQSCPRDYHPQRPLWPRCCHQLL